MLLWKTSYITSSRSSWALGAPLSFIWGFPDWWQPLLKECHGYPQVLSPGMNPQRITELELLGSTAQPSFTPSHQGCIQQRGPAAFWGLWSSSLALRIGNCVCSRENKPGASSGGEQVLSGAVCVTEMPRLRWGWCLTRGTQGTVQGPELWDLCVDKGWAQTLHPRHIKTPNLGDFSNFNAVFQGRWVILAVLWWKGIAGNLVGERLIGIKTSGL